MIQLISRGRRKAPVKKMRMRWAMIAPTNSSAAQWWIWRMTSPARTSKLMRMHRLVRLRHRRRPERDVAAVVGDLLRTRHEEEREVHAGEEQDDEQVEGELAQHERPVVREHLVERRPRNLRRAEAFVDPAGEAA